MENNDIKTIVGKNIRAFRKARKMTQVELARHLHYSEASMRNVISQIEKGKKGVPLERLKKIADVFGIHYVALLYPSEYTAEQIEMVLNLHDMMRSATDNIKSTHYDTIKHLLKQSRNE